MKNTLKIAILAFGVAVMAASCKSGDSDGTSTSTATTSTATSTATTGGTETAPMDTPPAAAGDSTKPM